MYIQDLYLKNFRSVEEQQYSLIKGVPVLIQGINDTDDGQESNGSGKSTFQIALLYNLTKLVVGNLKEGELVRRGEKQGEVHTTIICPIRREKLVICRTVKLKGSSSILITLNGDVKYNTSEGIGTVNDANDYILKWLDISKEDIQNFYIINKERYTSFFYSSNTKKIDLINRFSNAQLLKDSYSKIEVDINKAVEEVEECQRNILSTESKIEEVEEQIVEENDFDFEEDKKKRIEKIERSICDLQIANQQSLENTKKHSEFIPKYKEEISSLTKSITDLKDSITKEQEKSTDYSKELQKVNTEITNIDTQVEEHEDLIKTCNDTLKGFNSTVSSLETILAGKITCPKCSHEFVLDTEVTYEEAKKKKDDTLKEIKDLSEDIDIVQEEISKLEESISKYEAKKTDIKAKQRREEEKFENIRKEIKKLQTSLDSSQSNLRNHEMTIKSLDSMVEHNNDQVKVLKERILKIKEEENDDSRLISLKDKLKSLNVALNDLKTSLSSKEEVVEEVKRWKLNFKEFEGYLANKSLLVIQNRINDNLKSMGVGLRVRLEGFKQKADGNLKEEITPYILKDGEIAGFGSLSGGEKARVDFSNILSIQDILNSTHPYGGLDLVWIDEVLESSDALGLRNLCKSVNKENKSIYITTQNYLNDTQINTLTFKKTFGITKIV